MNSQKDDAPWRVNSVTKAFHILEQFAPTREVLTLTQLSQRLDMPKSTLLNMLKTLESDGYLYHTPNSSGYRLGYKVLLLGYNMRSSMQVIQYAIPFMEDLLAKTKETIYLTTHSGGQVFYLDAVYNSRRFGKYSVTGKLLPMHCTGCGKAMLSYMDEEDVMRIIQYWGLSKKTPYTITDPDRLLEELALCRKRGYALDHEEETLGVKCVATAIRATNGKPVGAISIQGTTLSITDDLVSKYANLSASVCTILAEHANLFPVQPIIM